MNKKNDTGTFDRRSFLKTLSLAGASGLVLPKSVMQASTKANSRVVIVEDSAATSGNTIDASVVESMIQSGIKSLAQNSDVGEAWKSLLPGVSSSSTIALKVNCLYTLCTHPIVTYAVADSLTQMMFGETRFPENNIIIYDRSDSNLSKPEAGYTINKTASGVRCMGTGYSGSYDVAGVSQKLSTILVDQADYLINIAVLKNHGMSGVSLCMKNHYGTCSGPGSLHSTDCNPYIAALNALNPIKNKQKVNIIDGLFGIPSGGPSGPPQFTANKILMSTDIVAIDYCGRELIKANGGTNFVKNSYHIETAAETYALGTNDPAKMDIVNITDPSTEVKKENVNRIPLKTSLEQNYPNPFNPTTNIKYAISKAGDASLRVYDIGGKEIMTLVNGYHSAGTYNVQFHGYYLSSGTYIYRLQTIDHILTQKMILIK